MIDEGAKVMPNTEPAPEARLRARLRTSNVQAYGALFLGAVCIGFSAIFTKWAALPGSVSAFYRVLIATTVLVIPYGAHVLRQRTLEDSRRAPKLTAPVAGMTLLAGFFFAADLGLWNTSLRFTTAANSTLLGNLSTVWVSLGALLIFHESLRRRFWLGMAIAIAGAAIVMGRDVLEHPHLGWGDLLSVGSSLFYAAYLLSAGRARRYLGTLPFMWLSSIAATLSLLVYVVVMRDELGGFSAEQWWSLIALGVISHALGWLAINYSLGHLPAPLASVTLLSQPVITAIVAVPLLGEGLSAFQIVGGLLVLTGIYIVNRR